MAWSDVLEAKTLSDETFETKRTHLEDNKLDHGLEIILTGTGTIALTPYTTISGREWVSNGTKITGFGATSGPDSDGKQILSLLLKPSEFVKFSIVVTGDVVLSLWFTQK